MLRDITCIKKKIEGCFLLCECLLLGVVNRIPRKAPFL